MMYYEGFHVFFLFFFLLPVSSIIISVPTITTRVINTLIKRKTEKKESCFLLHGLRNSLFFLLGTRLIWCLYGKVFFVEFLVLSVERKTCAINRCNFYFNFSLYFLFVVDSIRMFNFVFLYEVRVFSICFDLQKGVFECAVFWKIISCLLLFNVTRIINHLFIFLFLELFVYVFPFVTLSIEFFFSFASLRVTFSSCCVVFVVNFF